MNSSFVILSNSDYNIATRCPVWGDVYFQIHQPYTYILLLLIL